MKILSKLWHFHLCVHFYQILYANMSVFLPPPSPYFPIIIFCDRLRLPPPPPPISPSSSLIGCSFLHPHPPISPLSSSVINCFSFILLPYFPIIFCNRLLLPPPSPYFPIIIFCDRLLLPPPPPPFSPSSSSVIGCSFFDPLPLFLHHHLL